MRSKLATLLLLSTLALPACDEAVEVPPPPARPAVPVSATAFDCVAWAKKLRIAGDGDVQSVMCAESPHLPGLWLVQGPNGGRTLTVAVVDGKPVKGGGGAVAGFFRAVEIWKQPVTADDVGGVLSAVGAYPPGFSSTSPASFTPPFTYVLTAPLADWQGHGGPNAVAGAMPTGPTIRATLTTGPDVPTKWVIESGSGADWSPTATIQWDKGPPEGPLR